MTTTTPGACTCAVKPGELAPNKIRALGHTVGCPALRRPAPRTTLELRTIARRLAADVLVEWAYHYGRERGYLDLAGTRRRRSLEALERAAEEAAREYERAVNYDARELELDVYPEDVRDAFQRLADRRLARADRDPGHRGERAAMIRNALRRAAAMLTEEHELGRAADLILIARGVTGDLERIPNRSRTYNVEA